MKKRTGARGQRAEQRSICLLPGPNDPIYRGIPVIRYVEIPTNRNHTVRIRGGSVDI